MADFGDNKKSCIFVAGKRLGVVCQVVMTDDASIKLKHQKTCNHE